MNRVYGQVESRLCAKGGPRAQSRDPRQEMIIFTNTVVNIHTHTRTFYFKRKIIIHFMKIIL